MVTQRKQVLCVLHEEPRQGHGVSLGCLCMHAPGQTHANICKRMHIDALWTNCKNKGQSSGCVLFLDDLCPALEPVGPNSVSCLTPGHEQTREGDILGGLPW